MLRVRPSRRRRVIAPCASETSARSPKATNHAPRAPSTESPSRPTDTNGGAKIRAAPATIPVTARKRSMPTATLGRCSSAPAPPTTIAATHEAGTKAAAARPRVVAASPSGIRRARRFGSRPAASSSAWADSSVPAAALRTSPLRNRSSARTPSDSRRIHPASRPARGRSRVRHDATRTPAASAVTWPRARGPIQQASCARRAPAAVATEPRIAKPAVSDAQGGASAVLGKSSDVTSSTAKAVEASATVAQVSRRTRAWGRTPTLGQSSVYDRAVASAVMALLGPLRGPPRPQRESLATCSRVCASAGRAAATRAGSPRR
jgi:hypothetical protein